MNDAPDVQGEGQFSRTREFERDALPLDEAIVGVMPFEPLVWFDGWMQHELIGTSASKGPTIRNCATAWPPGLARSATILTIAPGLYAAGVVFPEPASP
jgi:hypothetical protein